MQIGKETDTTKRTQRPTEKTDRKKMYTQIKVDKQSQEKKKTKVETHEGTHINTHT